MASAATSMQTLFKQQVAEEFKREFNIVWKAGDRKCTISHKDNPNDFLACCAPGCVQQYVYTLTLLDGGKVQMVDNIEGSLNRAQAGMAAGNGNATQIVSVANMANKVMQKVSRIENQLMMHLNNMRLQSNNNTQSNAPLLPAAGVVAVPETQTIVRDIVTPLPESISDTQRAKLKALKILCDDGVLSFDEYQQIKKDTLASSSNPTVPQAQVIVDDGESSNNNNRSIADEITKLKELHSTGVLSDAEFQQAKASTLASFSK